MLSISYLKEIFKQSATSKQPHEFFDIICGTRYAAMIPLNGIQKVNHMTCAVYLCRSVREGLLPSCWALKGCGCQRPRRYTIDSSIEYSDKSRILSWYGRQCLYKWMDGWIYVS